MGRKSNTGELESVEDGSQDLAMGSKVVEVPDPVVPGGEISLVSQVNSTTGKVELVEVAEDYDYHQEIARSAFADMLHDHDRNMRYFNALRYEIAKLKSKGVTVNVLDIGTGTGLLSMMAVVAGADNVFACDAFTPMLECARRVVKRNGFEDRIKLIPKRSNELVVGVDIPYRCNLLVTEVFDTELIGEWAISTFNHAHKELLEPTAVVIPSSSTVYAQVVDCLDIEKWNSLPSTLKVSSLDVKFPCKVSQCPGVPSCQDLQLDAIQRDEFTPLSPPLPIFKFDFTSPTPISKQRQSVLNFKSESYGTANAVFLWWDLEMDTSGNNVLTCQPSYVSKGPSTWFKDCIPQTPAWRDHWMHSVYYIPRKEGIEDEGVLYAGHDEYSFWFDVSSTNELEFPLIHPVCECGVHTVLSRYQVYMMNDSTRFEKFVEAFENARESVCLCLSDCSVLPILLARIGAKRVFVVERCKENFQVTSSIVEENFVGDIVTVLNKDVENLTSGDLMGMKVGLLVGDPYFHEATYPWNNLLFWYMKDSLDPSLVSENLEIIPRKAVLRAVVCKFTHLWKINAPVGVAAGEFDLVDFDNLIAQSSSISDSTVDVQPLWEYETFATSAAETLLEFDLTSKPCKMESSGRFNMIGNMESNGVAIWVDWYLNDNLMVSTGPKVEPKHREVVIWERFSKQGVYFLKSRVRDSVRFNLCFNELDGDVSFEFE